MQAQNTEKNSKPEKNKTTDNEAKDNVKLKQLESNFKDNYTKLKVQGKEDIINIEQQTRDMKDLDNLKFHPCTTKFSDLIVMKMHIEICKTYFG